MARIRVDGMIFDDQLRDETLRQLAKSERIKGVIVHINSPGGTVAGSEALYESLRKVAALKPVVAVMSEAAASGGYITAIAADHIVARGNTLTGSIGVIAEIPNIVGLMEMLGVDVTRVKSAPLKAEPSLTTRPDAAAGPFEMSSFRVAKGSAGDGAAFSAPAAAAASRPAAAGTTTTETLKPIRLSAIRSPRR